MANESRIGFFIDHCRIEILANPYFAAAGYSAAVLYRKFTEEVTNVVYPNMTFAYESDKTELFANIDTFKLIIVISSPTFLEAERTAQEVITTLHQQTYADDNIVVYKLNDCSGPLIPIYIKDNNCYETIVNFDAAIA